MAGILCSQQNSLLLSPIPVQMLTTLSPRPVQDYSNALSSRNLSLPVQAAINDSSDLTRCSTENVDISGMGGRVEIMRMYADVGPLARDRGGGGIDKQSSI